MGSKFGQTTQNNKFVQQDTKKLVFDRSRPDFGPN